MEDRVDILRKIAEEHPKLEESISKTATFRNELERRKIHHEQLIGRADVRHTQFLPCAAWPVLLTESLFSCSAHGWDIQSTTTAVTPSA